MQLSLADESDEYKAFVEKFKPKKTTDDCYTPENIYEAIADWVSKEYRIDRSRMVRPFWPCGDYERFDYAADCVVVDNPPFSILSKIVRFYNEKKIDYFLFAPTLTNFQARDCSHIVADCDITYENGAQVRTSFLTNLDDWEVRTAPDLAKAVNEVDRLNVKATKKQLPKYVYPNHVLTAARCSYFSKHGIDYRLPFGESCRIGALDAQKAKGKSIFGDGYLLSDKAAAERAAAERAAAERAAAEKWELSDRELAIVDLLNKGAARR